MLSVFLLGIISFNSCKKDDDTPEPSPVPLAGFTYSGAGVPAPATVTFTNTSSNATSYSWDFGDNGTSTDKDPQHTYSTGGVYTVQLTASGPGGNSSITKTVNIQSPSGPTANFNFSGNGGQAPCVVTFSDASSGATSWSWDFGDGQTSTLQNPTHTYTTGNSFSVQLTVTGPNGSNSITKSVSVLAAPTVCKITGVSILNCSLTGSGGTSWDSFSGPDFYINLETTSGSILLDGSTSYNTDLSTFPQAWTVNPSYDITTSNWSNTYRIHIWEHDSPDADDDVAFCNFNISNYATVANHYPTQFTITSGSTQIKLTVQWQ